MPWTTPCRAVAMSFLSVCFLGVHSQTDTANQSQEVMHSDQTLRTSTRLVVVDVVATDSNGQVISDMKADDLKILEDGKQQKISSFTFHPPGKTDTVASIPLPANVVTNAPSF